MIASQSRPKRLDRETLVARNLSLYAADNEGLGRKRRLRSGVSNECQRRRWRRFPEPGRRPDLRQP